MRGCNKLADKPSNSDENKKNKQSDDKTFIKTRQVVGSIIILLGLVISALIVKFTPIIGLNSTSVNSTTANIVTASAALNSTITANAALNTNAALTSLGLVGLVTFIFVLFGTYLVTDKWDFKCGEFRTAITISVIAVFFGTLAFGNRIFIAPSTVLSQVLSNFWWIVVTVIGFYFGSRVIDNKTNKTDSTNNTSSNEDDRGSE